MRVLADIISVNYVGLRHYSTGFAVSDLLPALRVRVPQVWRVNHLPRLGKSHLVV
jgi:hypothetical protein